MTVRAEAEGLPEAVRDNQEMAERALDLSPVFAVIAEDLKTFVDDRFDTSTDPTGAQWASLAEVTKRRRRGSSPKPLVDTGTLRNSIAAQVSAGALTIGTNVPYAGPHQFGTTRIPARALFPFTEDGIVDEGLAAEEWERFERMIAVFIETGEIVED